MFKRLCKDEKGAIAIQFAIALPVLALLAGSALDMMRVTSFKNELQVIADNGAIFAARELAISSGDTGRIEASAVAYVQRSLLNEKIAVRAVANLAQQTVSVSIDAKPTVYFMNPFDSISTVGVDAVAQLAGSSGNLCLIALTDSSANAIELNNRAKLTADTCALYSNSRNARSLRVNSTAEIIVDEIFLVGGYKGQVKALGAEPVTDAPPIEDPLAGRQAPDTMGCTYNDFVADEIVGETTIRPGIYCGGLKVDGANVVAEAGEYIIKDGPLSVFNGGALMGDGVGFYFTGADAKVNFAPRSTISLSAPRTGMLAGLLFFSNKDNPPTKVRGAGAGLRDGHVIGSDDARRLVGTIYLPDDKLVVDGDTPVADQSEYTVIIAKAFELNNGPNLVLQTDYTGTDVPVPDGVGPSASGENVARLLQ